LAALERCALHANIGSALLAFSVQFDFEGEALTDLRRAQLRRDSGDMQEDLLAAVSGLNEAEGTLGIPGFELSRKSHA
jgi:hypothetical protein